LRFDYRCGGDSGGYYRWDMSGEGLPGGSVDVRLGSHVMGWLHYDEDVFCCVHCGALPEAAAEDPICPHPEGPRIAEYDPQGVGAAAAVRRDQRARQLADVLVASVNAGEDLGDVLARALGLAADRLGSVEALVARRPLSYEADFVRQLALRHASVPARAPKD
jgi:hypothetical protein